MSEEDRSLRMEFEREWLKQSLTKMRSEELDPADLCKLMQHYCQLKKEDNAQDKNLVSFSIAQSRLALAESRPSRRPLAEKSRAAPSPELGGGTPIADSNSQSTSDTSGLDPSDPDIDPEWSLAPWGRRKNGTPRTEREYRTILNRTVRDIYGLDLRDQGCRESRLDPNDPGSRLNAFSIQLTSSSPPTPPKTNLLRRQS